MHIRSYVIGPITCAISESGVFNPTIQSLVQLTIETLRPLGEVYSAHLAEGFGTIPLLSSSGILERDITWVSQADAVVALLPVVDNEPLRTDGTYIEIGFALASETPLIIAWSSHHAERYNHMIRGLEHCPYVRFLDINELAVNPDLLIDSVVELCRDQVHRSRQIFPTTTAHSRETISEFN